MYKIGYILGTFGYTTGTKRVHRRVQTRDTKGYKLGTRGGTRATFGYKSGT